MQYDLIDEKATADNVVENDAKELLNRATMLEYEYRRLELMAQGNPAMEDSVDDAWDTWDTANKEAEAFAKEAKLDAKEVGRVQRDVLRNIIANLEATHLQTERRRAIRAKVGIVHADVDNELDDLEKCKKMAMEMVKEKGSSLAELKADTAVATASNREEKRAAARQARKASGTTKKTAQS